MSQRFSEWCYWFGMILSMIGLGLYLSLFFFHDSLYHLFEQTQLGIFSLVDIIPFLMTGGVIFHFTAIFIPIKYDRPKSIQSFASLKKEGQFSNIKEKNFEIDTSNESNEKLIEESH